VKICISWKRSICVVIYVVLVTVGKTE